MRISFYNERDANRALSLQAESIPVSKHIRVLVVDDSKLIREIISDNIAAESDMEVVGKAVDGRQALAMIDKCSPDVVTLDIQMPGMDGLETLEVILETNPLPVIMVSALTQRGADTTLKALDQGAMDYVAKPAGAAGATSVLGEELVRKIRTMAGTDVKRMLQIRKDRAKRTEAKKSQSAIKSTPTIERGMVLHNKCIAIGISTGGPPALTGLFESLAPPMPPIVVVQHMPADFTKPFSWRLDSHSRLTVQHAQTGDLLLPDHVYIAPGGTHLRLRKTAEGVKVRIRDGDLVSGHRPSVDVMMKCAAEIYGDRCLGVIMTGMGHDGVDGCANILAAGGFVLGQDQATSDVYGMNKVAYTKGHVSRQFSLDDAATTLVVQMKRLWGKVPARA